MDASENGRSENSGAIAIRISNNRSQRNHKPIENLTITLAMNTDINHNINKNCVTMCCMFIIYLQCIFRCIKISVEQ